VTRNWKISIVGAVSCHLAVLFGFHVALNQPARPIPDTTVEVMLIAAPVAPVPPVIAKPAPPVEPLPPPPPPEPVVQSPEPLPVAEPEPGVAQLQPTPIAQPTLPAVSVPAPPVAAVITNSSPEPASTQTTVQAQPGKQERPNYRHNPKPPYPPLARRRGQEGLVLLTVKVTAEGRAAEVTLKQSSGYSLLDASALQAVRLWEFEPARLDSIAVASETEVPVRFQLRE
jgi:protein TonB